jgi:hypothetical protein
MSHLQYGLVVHAESGRIIYKTRKKNAEAGDVIVPSIKEGPQGPYGDVCYEDGVLADGYIVAQLSTDDPIDYTKQRWDEDTQDLRAATEAEETAYADVLLTTNAESLLSADQIASAIVEVMSTIAGEDVTDQVVAALKTKL